MWPTISTSDVILAKSFGIWGTDLKQACHIHTHIYFFDSAKFFPDRKRQAGVKAQIFPYFVMKWELRIDQYIHASSVESNPRFFIQTAEKNSNRAALVFHQNRNFSVFEIFQRIDSVAPVHNSSTCLQNFVDHYRSFCAVSKNSCEK